MLTTDKDKVRPGKADAYVDLNQIYSSYPYERRIRMQRVSAYAGTIVNFMWRNRMFTDKLTKELYLNTDIIYKYFDIDEKEKVIKNLLFENLSDDIIREIVNVKENHLKRWDEKGQSIPFSARICAVAEKYDELVQEEPYAINEGNGKIIKKIEEYSGTLFQPELVSALDGCAAILQKTDLELGVL